MIGQVESSTILSTPVLWNNPHMDKATLRARIQERLDVTGKSAHAVSREIGANPGYVRDLMDPAKGGYPKSDKLNALAKALETTSEYLIGNTTSPNQVLSEVGISEEPVNWRGPVPDLPPIPLVGTGDCASISFEDETGNMLEIERCSFDADHTVRMIARPPGLRGAQDLYAIYFHGESMLPRFEPGEVGIVDPRRPAGPGDYVIVQLNSGEDDTVASVLVKRLIRSNSRELVLEQFNPAAIFTVPKSRVARIHRILRETELLFG